MYNYSIVIGKYTGNTVKPRYYFHTEYNLEIIIAIPFVCFKMTYVL